MKRREWMLLAGAAIGRARAASLAEQSAAALLARHFRAPELSYLLLATARGERIAARWDNPEQAAAAGSLLKPFTALAFAETHRGYPEYVCTGKACWRARGHGRLNVEEALAQSCNAYFLALAKELLEQEPGREAMDAIARRFGLEAPSAGAGAEALAGMGDGWPVSPLRLARAYCELALRERETAIRRVLHGMYLSALRGTARGFGPGAYAKTGTAACSHSPHHAGDGFAIAIFPAESPRFALLVRLANAPGARAAAIGGEMREMLGRVLP